MRTIIAGSRSCILFANVVHAVAQCGWTPTVVLSGAALGADRLGERWAQMAQVPVEKYPAQWNIHGARAGKARNIKMAEKAEALIAIWNGVSPGTRHMIETAERMGLTVFVYRTDLKLPA